VRFRAQTGGGRFVFQKNSRAPLAKYSVALLRGWTGGLFYDADLFKKSQAIIGETHPHFR